MKIHEAIELLLAEESITNIDEFIGRVRDISKTKKKKEALWEDIEEYLLENAITDVAINLDTHELVYRDKLFEETAFRVNLTEAEYAAKKLYIGHRMIPYVHPAIAQEEYQFQDAAGNSIPVVREKMNAEEGFIYASLLPPYAMDDEIVDLQNNQISLLALDLSTWIKENELGREDQILFAPVDYYENIYQIEPVRRKEIAAQQLLIQRRDELLTNSIEEVLLDIDEVIPADITLFWAFALGDPKLPELPGTPLGPLLNASEDLQIFFDAGFAHIQMKDYYDELFDSAMEDMEAMSPEDMGKAKDLDGIFRELGSSFTPEFVNAKFVLQLHERQQIDTAEVINILFKSGTEPFYNKKQEKNFHKAFNELAETVAKDWATKRLPMPVLSMLKKTIQFKIEFIGLLREIDHRLTSPEDFDFSMLMHLQPVDMMLDQLLALLADKSNEISNQDVKGLALQVEKARAYFLEAKKDILDNM
ncbi:MAG: hypothetical protein HUU01_04470 [Saprospiraceae bacterium]|nr:hypothetical protein [Saprospiraceae bacterium]